MTDGAGGGKESVVDTWEVAVEKRDAWKAMAEAQARLLAAYRTGDHRRGAAAADAVGRARGVLNEMGEDTGKV